MSHINDLRRTKGHEGHSSKPTTFRGIEGERQRYESGQKLTRRQAELYGQKARIREGLTHHRNDKRRGEYHGHIHGGRRRTRRHRKSRSTRRR
uniref:Uncharacterized protein n=1 Tax=viral metagenome TaxID=1070528 RepID=A0A6C0JFQ7_9ZZZZ